MIRIRTPSRLHFGLIDPAGFTSRRFGGAGMMVERPGVFVASEPAAAWQIEGYHQERTQVVLRRLFARSRQVPPPLRVYVEWAPPQHVGLGVGTQLGLAVAWSLAKHYGWPQGEVEELALRAGRGARSAIGIRGFHQGGFLVDHGKQKGEEVAPLEARVSFPDVWRVVLVIPRNEQGPHGAGESGVFERLQPRPELPSELHHIIHDGILPALAARDFVTFSKELAVFNRLAGEPFRDYQQGPYLSPEVKERIDWIQRELATPGAGQSSWGPTVFAMAPDPEKAAWLVDHLRSNVPFEDQELVITEGNNQGALVFCEA
jgi:beta-RFAP synthase